MSARRRKSWQEKLADDKDLPKVIPITGKLRRTWGAGTCAIAAPREIDALIRRIPKGRVAWIDDLRAAVAWRHKATIGCPITTGIFTWISAYAAEEARAEGRKRITPWWRVLKKNGQLNPKYPGGTNAQTRLLRAEGHDVERSGRSRVPHVAHAKRVTLRQLTR